MVVARAVVREGEPWVRAEMPRRSPRQLPRPGLRNYLAILACCLVLFAANAVLHGFVTASAARVQVLAGELTLAEEEAQEIELEMAYLSSYPRIAEDSVTRLAMRAPAPGEYRSVPPAAGEVLMIAGRTPQQEYSGLVATVGGWLRDFGQAAASTH